LVVAESFSAFLERLRADVNAYVANDTGWKFMDADLYRSDD
jgi:hypothetical protein